MRATLLAIVAASLCAATGCANFNHSRRGGCGAPACAEHGGYAQPVASAAAVSPAVDPAAVAAAMPAASVGVAPYAAPGVATYAPAPNVAPYGPGRPRHWHHGVPYSGGGAAVAYPYYTIRGP